MQPPPPPPPTTVVFVPDTWMLQRTLHIQIQMLLSGCTCKPVPKAAALTPDRWKQSTSIRLTSDTTLITGAAEAAKRTYLKASHEKMKNKKKLKNETYFDAVIYTAEKRGPHSSTSQRQLTFATAPLERGPLLPGLYFTITFATAPLENRPPFPGLIPPL